MLSNHCVAAFKVNEYHAVVTDLAFCRYHYYNPSSTAKDMTELEPVRVAELELSEAAELFL